LVVKLPSPRKKKPIDDKQKSLFSFVEETQPKTRKIEPDIKKQDDSKEKEVIDVEQTKTEPESMKVPQKLFFKAKSPNFGLKEGNIPLQKVHRESVSSKYLRYLIEKGDIVENLERGLLLDVDYDGGQNKAYCKFYDLDNDDIKIWIDTTDHEPYCLSKEPISELEKLTYLEKTGKTNKLVDYQGFKRFEEIKRFELLSDKKITITKIYGKTPIDIGGSGVNIKNILGENEIKAWEADIRYHLNYIFDRQLIPGLIYRINNGKLEKIDYQESTEETKKLAGELRDIFKSEAPEMQEFSEKFIDIFLTPIPDVKRLAMDIEVKVGERDYGIPDPRLANREIISISFVASDGLKLVYILEREGFTFNKLHESFPNDAKIFFFKTEKELLTESFRILWDYPVVITFNGDNFDLNYMFHRAEKLKIDRDLNPIHVKRGFGIMSKAECDLRKGVHIDVFNFFFNRSISGYAFSGAYQSASLNSISAALLGEKKYEHEEEIHDMDYGTLAWYNLKDSILTLNLTKFNNSLVWNLIILLCRITKMPIHDMVRRQISSWIQNIFFFEHRRKEFLIPRKSEISESKKGGALMSKFDDGKFQGAYVIQPIPGIHYDVVVMDFSSLYPSIIKEYNLSYETVLCPHKDDEDNLVKGTPYHICTHKMGIFAYVVGFFRDTRVKYFKPKSTDRTLTQKQRSYYYTIQQALKVFINASYGVFGSQNFPLFCLPVAECYSKDTEILTENGWKFFKDLTKEKVASMNGKGELIYLKPIKYIISKYDGLMFSQESKNIDLLVTPNHNMYVGCLGRDNYEMVTRWSFRKAKNLPKNPKYKRNTIWVGKYTSNFILPSLSEADRTCMKSQRKPIKIKINDWLRFFGIWLAEGSTVKIYKGDYKVTISQSNLDKRKKIEGWLNQLPFHFNYIQGEFRIYNKQLWIYLKQFGKAGDKYIPRELLQLPLNQLKILFEAMMMGDGWRNRCYGTKSKKLADDVQELIFKMGYASTIRKHIIETPKSKKKYWFYTIYVSKTQLNPMQNKIVDRRKWIPYSDNVYCVEVPNHLLYVRRNGRACWCGNSTTGIGQYSIKQTIKKAEELGVKVLYGDTDSVFLSNPSKSQMKEISDWSKKELDLDLEEEKTYQFLALSQRKKNYVGIYKDTKFVDIKGLVVKKKNTPEFIKKTFSQLLEILKQITNDNEFQLARKEIIEIIKRNLKNIKKVGAFTLEDYAINISLQKHLKDYTKSVPQHVRAANAFIETEIAKAQANNASKNEIIAIKNRYQKGDIVTFIKSKGPIGAKVTEHAKLQDINSKKYRDLLKSALEQVLDALGISFEEIKGIKKMDAFF